MLNRASVAGSGTALTTPAVPVILKVLEQRFSEVGVKIVYFPYTKGTSSTLVNEVLQKLRSSELDELVQEKANTTKSAEDWKKWRDDAVKKVDKQLDQLEANCKQFGIPHEGMHGKRQGIVHVIGPELGLTQPGMTIVCGDSHTSTHGAFGAFAFGIGTSEVAHVLATQCLLQRRPRTLPT